MRNTLNKICGVIFSLVLVLSVFGAFKVVAGELALSVTKVEVKEKSPGVKVQDVTLDSGDVTNKVIFRELNTFVKYNVTVKNSSSDEITLKSVADDNASSYLEYTYSDVEGVKVAANSEYTFVLTITYKTQSSDVEITADPVSLTINYETPDGEVKGATTNPETNDGLYKYIILSVVSVIGIIITVKSRRVINGLMIVVLSLTMLLPLGIAAKEEALIIKFNNTITNFVDPYRIGDIISIGDEDFYFIGWDDYDHIKLLSKYGLSVGKNFPNPIERQDESAKGTYGGMSINQFKGGVAYSTAGSDYETSNIKTFVDNYADYLNTLDVNVTGRLITLEELFDLGCVEHQQSCSAAPAWLYAFSYWTQSIEEGWGDVYVLTNQTQFSYYSLDPTTDYSHVVRPVIIMEV